MNDDGTAVDPGPDNTNSANKTGQPANFLGIPLKGWAIFAVSFIVVCYTAAHFTVKLYGELAQVRSELVATKQQKSEIARSNDKATRINKDTSVYTDAVTKEKATHEHDGSGHRVVLHSDGRGEIVATYFASDGCIAIARPGPELAYMPPQSIVEWSLGPAKKPPLNPPVLDQSALNRSELPAIELPNVLSQSKETGRLRYVSTEDRQPRLLRVQAGCLNPHPGPFRSWWGPASGCWAPFYRQWNDGCTHYQMYNACTGQWDPRINWTACVAQHHP
ncbi:MAG: hypothetical protein LAN70_10880 [Acidobacteriia bacterium]|nr:hypothetical protein [Terriglobia bacterium]